MIDKKKLIEKIVNTPTKCLNEFSISGGDLTTIARNGILHGCANRQREIIDMIEELAEEPTECSRSREAEIECIKAQYYEENDSLKRRIAELEHDLMIYEQKWSVIQLIFGK